MLRVVQGFGVQGIRFGLGSSRQQDGPESSQAHSRLDVASSLAFPKDPCTYIVYTWPLKLLYRNPFKAPVYTI